MEIKIMDINFIFPLMQVILVTWLPKFQISEQAPGSSLFIFLHFFFSLEERHFSQRLLEPGDIEIAHKQLNSATHWLGQALVPIFH